jgi:predicted nucleic acid-binding protein
VTALWDTTLASRLHPHGEVFEYVVARAAEGWPVHIAAPAIIEIAYGHQRAATTDARFPEQLAWFSRILRGEAFLVVALGGRAAYVAGRLRGAMPYPPGKRDHRSKPMRQAAWLIDIQIAATAFAGGFDVATANRRDFEALSGALVALFPAAPPLAVVDGPA